MKNKISNPKLDFVPSDILSLEDLECIVQKLKTYQAENEELQTLNEDLEQRMRERTRLAEEKTAQLQQLTSQLVRVEQIERKRLAHILHDHLQQLLIAAKFSLGRLHQNIRDKKMKHLAEQVDDLINDSIESSRSLTVELSPPILHDAGLGAALEWLGRWMKEKNGLEVKLSIQSEIKASEEVNFFLFQAVRELLLNVLKHAKVNRVSLKMRCQEDNILIAVEDKGVGFDPLFMEDEKITSAGFGLFNIRKRIEMIGGKLDIQSHPGRGSLFTLIVPSGFVEPKDSFQMEPVTSEPVAPHHLSLEAKKEDVIRVIVVDDHKIVRQGLVNVLESQSDISVIGEGEDGEEAIHLASTLVPDVMIMDVSMPKLNGIEATRRIKQQKSDIKIIGLSFHEAEDMTERMLSAGAEFYLNKSVPADMLISTIRNISHPYRNLQPTLPF